LDSNQRRQKPAGLQPAPIGHSGNPPEDCVHPAVVAAEPIRVSSGSIRAGEGTRTPNRLLTKQVLYQLSYTSVRSWLALPAIVGQSSPLSRPAEMVSKVECAPEMRSLSKAPLRWTRETSGTGETCTEDNCALRLAFALPAGKNHARREIVRREAIDASRLANPNRT
jgi:hypothetical protein